MPPPSWSFHDAPDKFALRIISPHRSPLAFPTTTWDPPSLLCSPHPPLTTLLHALSAPTTKQKHQLYLLKSWQCQISLLPCMSPVSQVLFYLQREVHSAGNCYWDNRRWRKAEKYWKKISDASSFAALQELEFMCFNILSCSVFYPLTSLACTTIFGTCTISTISCTISTLRAPYLQLHVFQSNPHLAVCSLILYA